jgi:outer membrane protein assembly factor BamB
VVKTAEKQGETMIQAAFRLLCAVAGLGVISAVAAEPDAARLSNWHQWRGPLATGTAPQGNPPVEWSDTKNVRWKVEIPGKGSASPIVWNDRVFVLTAVPTGKAGEKQAAAAGQKSDQKAEQGGNRRRGGGFGQAAQPTEIYQFLVLCINRRTGNELWRQTAVEEVPHEPGHQTNTFASGSPVTDGEFLYASFGSYGIFCYDLDGKQKWKQDLGDMRTRNGFGEGASPTLYKDTLIIPWDHEGQSFMAALDAKTGDLRWKTEHDEVTTWVTPLVVEHQGRTQVITNGTKRARSYDLATGSLIWECGGQVTNPIACPLTLDGLAVVMTGYQGYAVYAIPLDSTGDITDTDKIAWKRTDTGPYISSPVLIDGLIYVTKSRDAVLSILEAKTGNPLVHQKRLPGLGVLYASPVAAAGRLYYTDRNGTTVVIKQGTDAEVLATNHLGEGVDASPAVAGNQMFLRGEKHLFCLEAAP